MRIPLILRCTKCRRRANPGVDSRNCGIFARFPQGKVSQSVFSRLPAKVISNILLQRGIAIFDCEAAALPGRFLPELGRPRAAIFFAPSFWP
ncbi:MAG TPA: hypothetical protein VII48_04960, partial [Rhizomicrobium sp.]